MIYITIYGKFCNNYVENKQGVYWLTESINRTGFGYILLRKTDSGSYQPIRVLQIE